MDALRIRMYNVRFGDAFLLSVPDCAEDGAPVTRHILIDVGNSLNSEGGLDTLFKPVVENILEELGEQGLDLYVLSHPHLDHAQGLPYENANAGSFPASDLARRLKTRHTWMPISCDPQYHNEEAQAALKAAVDTYAAIARQFKASGAVSEEVSELLAINDPSETADCVQYLRTLAPEGHTWYVHRGVDLHGKHDFRAARFEVWAPEESVAGYYAGFLPMETAYAASQSGGTRRAAETRARTVPLPPPGVDMGVFYHLVESRRMRWVDNLLALDKSVNNTSVVFCLEWRGRRLLFPGDAELSSWAEMEKRNVLKEVDFLKVSHHGSYNGTPHPDVLEKLLPAAHRLEHPAALSSFRKPHKTIPSAPTLAMISEHSQIFDIRGEPEKPWVDIFIQPEEAG